MATGFLKAALEFWQSLGKAPTRAVDVHGVGEELFLYVPHAEKRVLVGVLSRDGGDFVFRYSPEFQQRDDIPPIPSFPDRWKAEYRSPALWPFFEVRLPPLDRSDVSELIRKRHLDEHDKFLLLAELGKKSVTTPYEFELHRPRPA